MAESVTTQQACVPGVRAPTVIEGSLTASPLHNLRFQREGIHPQVHRRRDAEPLGQDGLNNGSFSPSLKIVEKESRCGVCLQLGRWEGPQESNTWWGGWKLAGVSLGSPEAWKAI